MQSVAYRCKRCGNEYELRFETGKAYSLQSLSCRCGQKCDVVELSQKIEERKTATQIRMEDQERINSLRLQHAYRYFLKRWTPDDPEKATEFQSDLAMMMHELHKDSLKPIQDTISALLCQMNHPVIIKTDKS